MKASALMASYNEKAFSKFDNEALVQCKNCFRTFLPDRLEIHLRSCLPGKPLKMRAGLEPKPKQEYYGAVINKKPSK